MKCLCGELLGLKIFLNFNVFQPPGMNDKSNFQRRHKKIPLFGDAVHYLILLTTAQLFKITEDSEYRYKARISLDFSAGEPANERQICQSTPCFSRSACPFRTD